MMGLKTCDPDILPKGAVDGLAGVGIVVKSMSKTVKRGVWVSSLPLFLLVFFYNILFHCNHVCV